MQYLRICLGVSIAVCGCSCTTLVHVSVHIQSDFLITGDIGFVICEINRIVKVSGSLSMIHQ